MVCVTKERVAVFVDKAVFTIMMMMEMMMMTMTLVSDDGYDGDNGSYRCCHL